MTSLSHACPSPIPSPPLCLSLSRSLSSVRESHMPDARAEVHACATPCAVTGDTGRLFPLLAYVHTRDPPSFYLHSPAKVREMSKQASRGRHTISFRANRRARITYCTPVRTLSAATSAFASASATASATASACDCTTTLLSQRASLPHMPGPLLIITVCRREGRVWIGRQIQRCECFILLELNTRNETSGETKNMA